MGTALAHRDQNAFGEATTFLVHRFASNTTQYAGSFARELNDEAAIELAEIIWGAGIVCKVRELLKTRSGAG